jgi:hypothetical protein
MSWDGLKSRTQRTLESLDELLTRSDTRTMDIASEDLQTMAEAIYHSYIREPFEIAEIGDNMVSIRQVSDALHEAKADSEDANAMFERSRHQHYTSKLLQATFIVRQLSITNTLAPTTAPLGESKLYEITILSVPNTKMSESYSQSDLAIASNVEWENTGYVSTSGCTVMKELTNTLEAESSAKDNTNCVKLEDCSKSAEQSAHQHIYSILRHLSDFVEARPSELRALLEQTNSPTNTYSFDRVLRFVASFRLDSLTICKVQGLLRQGHEDKGELYECVICKILELGARNANLWEEGISEGEESAKESSRRKKTHSQRIRQNKNRAMKAAEEDARRVISKEKETDRYHYRVASSMDSHPHSRKVPLHFLSVHEPCSIVETCTHTGSLGR